MRLSPAVLTLFAVGLVLRPQIVGVGPLLPKIESSLDISHGVAGLLTTIPVFCMGVFAPLAPPLLRHYGSRIAIGASLLGVAAFGVLRAVAPGVPLLLLLTVPVGMGIAAAGTLMPVVVKEEHPERPALGTGVYTTGINVGATMAAVVAAPLAIAIGWRGTLVLFSVLSLAAVLPWLARRHRASAPPERAPLPFRVRVAWLLAAMFALQSIFYYGFNAWLADVYTERGWGDTEAGALVAVLNAFALVTGVTTALVGDRAPRRTFLRLAAWVAVVGSVAVAADVAGAWAWAALLGASAGMLFTIVMTLPLDAAGSRTEVAAMTTLMLGVGYSISAFAPVVLGAVRDASGSFTAALALLACDSFALLVVTLRMPARIREMSENPAVRRSPRRPGGGKEIR